MCVLVDKSTSTEGIRNMDPLSLSVQALYQLC